MVKFHKLTSAKLISEEQIRLHVWCYCARRTSKTCRRFTLQRVLGVFPTGVMLESDDEDEEEAVNVDTGIDVSISAAGTSAPVVCRGRATAWQLVVTCVMQHGDGSDGGAGAAHGTKTDAGVYHDCAPLLVPCDCPQTACIACAATMAACALADHHVLCPQRRVLCLFCRRAVQSAQMTKHYALQCREYRIRCWQCSVPVCRYELETHRLEWHTHRPAASAHASPMLFQGVPCALPEPQACPLSVLGCSYVCPPRASTHPPVPMHAHLTQCTFWRLSCPVCEMVVARADWTSHVEDCYGGGQVRPAVLALQQAVAGSTDAQVCMPIHTAVTSV